MKKKWNERNNSGKEQQQLHCDRATVYLANDEQESVQRRKKATVYAKTYIPNANGNDRSNAKKERKNEPYKKKNKIIEHFFAFSSHFVVVILNILFLPYYFVPFAYFLGIT